VKLPKDGDRFRIVAQDYIFHLAPYPPQPEALGWCDSERNEIWVHPKLCQGRRLQVFWHEVTEAMNFESTLNLEHDQIDRLESDYFGFFRDNPDLFAEGEGVK
jgi:hypothetical protein